MRNIFLFWGALLLVDGVFGVNVTLSVMEGDSLTLKPQTEIPEDDSAEWKFGDKIIARFNKAAGRFSTSDGPDERFRDRLNLDKQTGSLTITNTRSDHTGLYTLKIRTTAQTLHDIFSVTVRDVVKSLSVMEGDTVTLHTGVTDIQRDDQILWKSGDQVLNGPDDTKWRNIHRNNETGVLSIRNIQTDQAGYYELEINTASVILHRKMHITIHGEMKPVSVEEGKSITLDTGLIGIKGYDLITWKFKDQLIAEFNKGINPFSTPDTSDERFKGRLKLGQTTVSLIIRDSRITDSGDYSVHMNSSSHTVQRNISVTVSDSGLSPGDKGLSPGAVTGIAVGVLLLVFAAVAAGVVIYHRHRISELQRPKDDAENIGTGVPLNKVTG